MTLRAFKDSLEHAKNRKIVDTKDGEYIEKEPSFERKILKNPPPHKNNKNMKSLVPKSFLPENNGNNLEKYRCFVSD